MTTIEDVLNEAAPEQIENALTRDYSLLRPFDLEAAKLGEEFWSTAVGSYFVSSLGRVKGPKGIMSPSETKKGYLRVCLSIDGKQFEAKVHRLVASAFIENFDNLPQVNHINGDKKDNSVTNLEWCSNKENSIHYRNVLKGGLVPLVAVCGNEVTVFESWSAAKMAGHNVGEISRIIGNKDRKHHGYNWYRKYDFQQKMSVLAWVEGKPVYKGDRPWNANDGKQYTVDGFDETTQVFHTKEDRSDGAFSLCIEDARMNPPKVTRSGWAVFHRAAFALTEEDAQRCVSGYPGLVAVRGEWEETE